MPVPNLPQLSEHTETVDSPERLSTYYCNFMISIMENVWALKVPSDGACGVNAVNVATGAFLKDDDSIRLQSSQSQDRFDYTIPRALHSQMEQNTQRTRDEVVQFVINNQDTYSRLFNGALGPNDSFQRWCNSMLQQGKHFI